MKYNQKKKKENIEIFLFIMVIAVFAAVLGVMSLGEKMQPVNQTGRYLLAGTIMTTEKEQKLLFRIQYRQRKGKN